MPASNIAPIRPLSRMGDAALALILLHNFAVFPCSPLNKTPLTTHGFKDATTDGSKVVQ